VTVNYGLYFTFGEQDCSSGLLNVMTVQFSILLTALVNIQPQLENPLDHFTEDAVVLNTQRSFD